MAGPRVWNGNCVIKEKVTAVKPSMIFHHPFPVEKGGKSGSQVRPYQMLEAFQAIGFEVAQVTGYGAERKKAIQQIYSDVKGGRSFAFAYSESHTLPTLLTEPHHFPSYPTLDFSFLAQLKKWRIPVGLFYRDVYWRFDLYRTEPFRKRVTTLPMFRYDWWQYQHVVDHLFLPALSMQRYLPSRWPSERLSALPPGSNFSPSVPRETQANATLQLLYVGGVLPPLYNLQPTFDYLNDVPNAHLTLCCRREEWEKVKAGYRIGNASVTIVHASGEELQKLYKAADIFVILRKPHDYLSFAMPVKVFETLAHGLPILTLEGSETARFVKAEQVGWVISSQEEFKHLLHTFETNPNLLTSMRQNVWKAAEKHTWQARALQVAKTLQT
jgi:glycosyltransferase involved in cell wall biosynthesis